MTDTATPLLTGLPATLPARLGAGHGWERCLVVLLRFSDDDGKEKLLLPHGRLTGAIKPSVGRLPWTTQSGNDHGGGIRGERISEGHGQIIPQKKKYAMQKINLAKCPQCRQSLRMSNTALTATLTITGYDTDTVCECCGKKLVHGIRLADGRTVGAQCFNRVLTKPLTYSGKTYRVGAENIIRRAKVREFYSSVVAAQRFGFYSSDFIFECAK